MQREKLANHDRFMKYQLISVWLLKLNNSNEERLNTRRSSSSYNNDNNNNNNNNNEDNDNDNDNDNNNKNNRISMSEVLVRFCGARINEN